LALLPEVVKQLAPGEGGILTTEEKRGARKLSMCFLSKEDIPMTKRCKKEKGGSSQLKGLV